MRPAPLPPDEGARLAALEATRLLDAPPEPAFDDLVALAATVCGTPIALVSLADRERVWFKANVGIPAPVERRRLEARRELAERRLRLSHAAAQVLAEAATIEEAAPRLVREVGECLGLDFGAIWSADGGGGRLRCVDWGARRLYLREQGRA